MHDDHPCGSHSGWAWTASTQSSLLWLICGFVIRNPCDVYIHFAFQFMLLRASGSSVRQPNMYPRPPTCSHSAEEAHRGEAHVIHDLEEQFVVEHVEGRGKANQHAVVLHVFPRHARTGIFQCHDKHFKLVLVLACFRNPFCAELSIRNRSA